MGMGTASHEMSTFSKRKDFECMLSDSQIGNTTTLEAIYPTTTGLFPVKLSKTQ
ncbi:hypothetical protein T11_6390 [Trichinella zimbabwensis]|uniref:Uncharacterized protein n=1 Tax=Trichinella zimbabwensis TaxID=268475 RepID=A0A0V1H2U6_9BILA|nr:hypothetical protein T11_6390 [Trichinella zimbabwensis]